MGWEGCFNAVLGRLATGLTGMEGMRMDTCGEEALDEEAERDWGFIIMELEAYYLIKGDNKVQSSIWQQRTIVDLKEEEGMFEEEETGR